MKQVVPYAKFLRRAVKVKRDPARHLETLPSMPAAEVTASPGRLARLPSAGSVLRLAVALGLTAFILWKSEPALVWEHAARARPGPLVAAVLLVVVDRTLMAWRWLWLLVPFAPAAR